MVDFAIFRYSRLTAANLITLLFAACIGSTLFLLTLYMQQVLGYSALEAGLALLRFLRSLAMHSVCSSWCLWGTNWNDAHKSLLPRFSR